MEKREQVRSIIESQKGKFFTVIFSSKQDGTVRLINGRTGVHKYVKGTGVNPAVGKSDLLSAFNVKKMAYRTINLDGVVEIRAGGKKFNF